VQPEWAVLIEVSEAAETTRLHGGLSHLGPRYADDGARVEVVVRAPTEAAAVEYVTAQANRMQIRPRAVVARPIPGE
jgi:hypothetical protein